ncbi:MAG TPA: putative motility protein [Zoogloea sp.]|nr:putative motility protein [Zoogloea sp.]
MNISSVASTSQVQTQDAVSVAMLRKSLDQQQAAAAQMIASLPQPASLPDPSATMGRSVDTYA